MPEEASLAGTQRLVDLLTPSDVADRLLSEGYRFNFFQAVHLIERMHAAKIETEQNRDPFNHAIRIRPSPSLAFPASDVKRVEVAACKGGNEHIRLTATFMGLYGVDASLPPHFHEGIERGEESAKALQDFLDIFNHRIYVLLYKAWRKYRPSFHPTPPGYISDPATTAQNDSSRDARRILSLAGLRSLPKRRPTPVNPMELACFSGRLRGCARNAEGLAALIRSQLGGIDIAILENIPRWVRIPVRSSLGENKGIRLGMDATIGKRVYDRSGKFRIRIGPVNLATFRSLMPNAERARKIAWLVRLHGPDHLDYDVAVTLRSDNTHRAGLGTTGELGLSTVLGQTQQEITRIFRYSEDALSNSTRREPERINTPVGPMSPS